MRIPHILAGSISSLVLAGFIAAPFSWAANQTWDGGEALNGNWSTLINWASDPLAAPGSTIATNNPDVATFNAAIANGWGLVGTPIVIDSATQNIRGLKFDTAAGNYFIGTTGGNALRLSSGGAIQIFNTLTATNAIQTINAPLVIQDSNGSYTFANNSANGSGAGAGTLNFGGGITGTAAGATNLVLSGSNTNANTISGIIGNGGATALRINKNGDGTWNLNGNNTYTGTTDINGGLLRFNGVNTGLGAINVSRGNALGGTGTVAGLVTVNAGGAIRLTDGVVGTLTINNALAFNGGAADPVNLFFDLNNAGATTDRIVTTGAVTATGGAGAVRVNFNQLAGGQVTPGLGKILIQAGAVSLYGNYALATTRSGGNVYSNLVASGNNLVVDIATAAAGPAAAFWVGGANPWTTVANWNTDATSGTPLGSIPGVGTNVTFATTAPAATNLTTNTVDADFEINSLGFNDLAGGVTIGGTGMLTIDATTANGNAAGNGITSGNTSGTNTISTKISLGGNQTWTTSGGTLAVSGVISDSGGGYSLTKAGAGILTLTGKNSYTGATAIDAGELQISGTGSLGTLTPGVANYAGNIVNNGTLRYSSSENQKLSGIISGTGSLIKDTSASILTLTGTSTYTGKTTIFAGTLQIGNGNGTDSVTITNAGVAGPLGAPTGANAIIDLHPGVTMQMGSTEVPRIHQFTDRTINLAGAGGTVSIKVNDNDTNFTFGAVTATGTGAKTLALVTGYGSNGDRTGMIFNGPISNVSDGSPLSLDVTSNTSTPAAPAFVSLKAGGTFTGPITLNGGVNVANAYLVIGGVLTRNGGDNTTFVSTPGSGTLTAGNYANTVSLGLNTILYYNSTAAQTLSGVISGVGSLGKGAAGTLTLTGVNTYTGPTTINGGLLKVNGSLAVGGLLTIVTIQAGGALGGTGTANPPVIANAGGAIRLSDGVGTINTLTLTSATGNTLTFNGTVANPNNLYFDLGAASTDKITTAKKHVSPPTANTVLVNLNQLASTSIATGTYNLIETTDGGEMFGYALATTRSVGKIFALDISDGKNLRLSVNPAPAGPPAAFWAGGSNPWTTLTNWRTDAASNITPPSIPGVGTNVTFATTNPVPGNLTTNSVDADFEINSLTFNAAAGGVTILGPRVLTIDATAANGNVLGNGITSGNTSGTNIISAMIGMGGNQTWTTSGGALTVNGGITDFGRGFTLTKAGPGILTLSGANTSAAHSGGTVVSGGELIVGGLNFGGLTNTTAVNINTGTLTLGASNMINDAASVTLSGTSTLNTGGFSDTLASTLTLSGTSTIDFGAGSNSSLIFTTLALASGATNTLAIWNWTTLNGFDPDPGIVGDGLRDRLLFTGIALNSLTADELSRISFYSDSGITLLGTAAQISIGSTDAPGGGGQTFSGYHELVPVPVPEPTTIFGALALLGLVGYRERRRLKSALAASI